MPEADFFSSKMSCCMAEQEERIEIDGWEIERSFPQQYFFFRYNPQIQMFDGF